ncbi:DUF2809 domain-containing protein [Algibacter amylolyticus]|uniref:DUF2809 domain-containing protein n=1 Tax=Algibacter amylolyticus TaxID=1608400 RepID=A0A5M7B755_9FLAO|nr:DUF2809 domain-containing protein [Algibacter amylolyticus]KAA5824067.1 DUF2809 domain-containing protein [Algibacter amylolyticus]MBB5269621.1 hypothetical protein [Algibacter amylolyticus]TSJ74544.1 DUF2809 domain-containing protein [Algibacter amylolyticus]
MKLNKTYLLLTILLFTIETLIAIYLKTGFIRHTFGDFLCVILLYCFFKTFIEGHHFKIAVIVLAIAFTVEFLQLTNFLELFNLHNNQLAKLILGSTFQISDLVAYSLGIISVIILEYKVYKLWIT